MALTEDKCRAAKPLDRDYRLADSHGLCLCVMAKTGAKVWRYRCRVKGKAQTLTFGRHPEMTLREARQKRDAARLQLDRKQDPRNAVVATDESRDTFQAVAERWHAVNTPRWRPHHAEKVWKKLNGVLTGLGDVPIKDITRRMLLDEIRKKGSARVQHGVRGYVERIIKHGIAESVPGLDANVASAITAAMPPTPKTKHHPAPDTLEGAREVMRILEATTMQPLQRLLIRFGALTLVRPGWELCDAQWTEIRKDHWHVPAERMKMDTDHVVPLSVEALEVLGWARKLSGGSRYIFPHLLDMTKPCGEFSGLYRRAGLRGVMTPHGWRSAFSTVMHERHPDLHVVLELMIAHSESGAKGAVSAAYNRSLYMSRREELAHEWAGLIMDGMLPVKELVALPRQKGRRG